MKLTPLNLTIFYISFFNTPLQFFQDYPDCPMLEFSLIKIMLFFITLITELHKNRNEITKQP
jgi:hypothetical protein